MELQWQGGTIGGNIAKDERRHVDGETLGHMDS
jgi:hypothetical protein